MSYYEFFGGKYGAIPAIMFPIIVVAIFVLLSFKHSRDCSSSALTIASLFSVGSILCLQTVGSVEIHKKVEPILSKFLPSTVISVAVMLIVSAAIMLMFFMSLSEFVGRGDRSSCAFQRYFWLEMIYCVYLSFGAFVPWAGVPEALAAAMPCFVAIKEFFD